MQSAINASHWSASTLTAALTATTEGGSAMTAIHDDRTIARFWAKVNVRGPDECWEWTAYRLDKGYGVFHADKVVRAHVFAYEVTVGSRRDLCVLHTCDNPPCCNPGHLWLGTNQDNVDDKMSKGRHNCGRGDGCGRSKLSSVEVQQIRMLITEGMTNVAIGRMFGVSDVNISCIRHGKSWRSVPVFVVTS